MPQGILGFQYAEEKSGQGLTGLAGLPAYLDLIQAARLPQSIRRHVGMRQGGQGYTDAQVILPLVLLNLAGGDAVEDVRILEKDEGLCRVLRRVGRCWESRRVWRQQERRWRKKRQRTIPSASAVQRYMGGFHDAREEEKRVPHTAYIPQPNAALRGMGWVNGDMLAFMQKRDPQHTATLDGDASIVPSEKAEALYSYKGYPGYQPLSIYWAEQDAVVHSEFRDGNVPAGYQQRRVLEEALALLPAGVDKVCHRSDTAGYQQEVLEYCAEGQSQRFGVIEFAIGVDVTPQFREAVQEVATGDWHPLEREADGRKHPTDQQWAEVCFVPNWVGHKKSSKEYSYLAIREPVRQPVLPGMEEQLPFPTVFAAGQRYKITGVVTNRKLAGDAVIRWYRERCGKSEEAHHIMKEELAGGKLPSGAFGKNAAWWAIMVLAFNLHSAMKRFLDPEWRKKRLKAVRFALIAVPGRVVQRGRQLLVRLSQGHPSLNVLIHARQRILAGAAEPTT